MVDILLLKTFTPLHYTSPNYTSLYFTTLVDSIHFLPFKLHPTTIHSTSLQMTIWRMRIACCIPKASNTNSEYVILIAFPQHHWWHETTSMLCYTHTACLVCFFLDVGRMHKVQMYFLNMKSQFSWLCVCVQFHFCQSATAPRGALPPYYWGYTITLVRTPLDEWSAHRRDLYLITHNTRQTSMPPGGIRTCNPSKRAVADSSIRPLGHWDRPSFTLFPPQQRVRSVSSLAMTKWKSSAVFVTELLLFVSLIFSSPI